VVFISTHTHTRFNGPFSRTTRVGRYQKGKTNLDFTEARDSEWQSHQLGHMQVCTLIQTDNHASTSPLVFISSHVQTPKSKQGTIEWTTCAQNARLNLIKEVDPCDRQPGLDERCQVGSTNRHLKKLHGFII